MFPIFNVRDNVAALTRIQALQEKQKHANMREIKTQPTQQIATYQPTALSQLTGVQ